MPPQSPAKHPLEGILICPQSGEPLEFKGGAWVSPKNGAFPQTSGISWLYRRPQSAINHWRKKIADVLTYSRQAIERIERHRNRQDLLPATRERLERLHKGHQKNILHLSKLLDPLVGGAGAGELEALERVPRQQSAMAYQATLFRDWAWGQTQIGQYASYLTPSLAGKKRLAFLGAGACGLPVLIHNQIRPEFSLAVDINPILLTSARRMMDGETVSMMEFPTVPAESNRICLEHNLKMDGDVAPGFETLLCDGQNLPVKDQSLDAVVTSWFVDVVPGDFRTLAQSINSMLEKGGIWSNIGQIGFDKNDPTQVYTHDEIKEVLGEAGFEIESWQIRELPYLQSPNDGVGRHDKILIFAARKGAHKQRPKTQEYWPDWISNSAAPIPLTDELREFRVRSAIYTFVADQADGKRSVKEIAKILAREFGLPENEAVTAVHNFFANYYEGVIYREF